MRGGTQRSAEISCEEWERERREKREEKNGEVGEETAQPSDIKQTVGSLKICQKEISAG